jgi:hypothetical protein
MFQVASIMMWLDDGDLTVVLGDFFRTGNGREVPVTPAA